MRKRAVATLVLPLGLAACGESPLASRQPPRAEVQAEASPVDMLILTETQVSGLSAILDDARTRVLPGLPGGDGVAQALARVNLAGVQALTTRTDALRSQVQALSAENAQLRGQVSDLEARLQRLEALLAQPSPTP